MKKNLVIAAIAAGALTLSACTSSGEAATGESGEAATGELKVSGQPINIMSALTLGEEMGIFEDHDLDVRFEKNANPTAGIAAVQGGQVDLAYTPTVSLLTALQGGIDLQVIAAADGYPEGSVNLDNPADSDYQTLWANKDSGISRPADLEGKQVSVPARNAALEVMIADAVKQDGGDPTKINWLVLDFPSALQSLNNGDVDAAGMVMPFMSAAEGEGHTFISALGFQFYGEGAAGYWVTTSETAEAKSEEFDRFRDALYESHEFASENYDALLDEAAELTTIDRDVLENGPIIAWPTSVSLEDIELVDRKMTDLDYLDKPQDLSNILAQN